MVGCLRDSEVLGGRHQSQGTRKLQEDDRYIRYSGGGDGFTDVKVHQILYFLIRTLYGMSIAPQ